MEVFLILGLVVKVDSRRRGISGGRSRSKGCTKRVCTHSTSLRGCIDGILLRSARPHGSSAGGGSGGVGLVRASLLLHWVALGLRISLPLHNDSLYANSKQSESEMQRACFVEVLESKSRGGERELMKEALLATTSQAQKQVSIGIARSEKHEIVVDPIHFNR